MSSATRSRARRPHTAVAARWGCAPPIQRRAHETLDRFAEVTEELLRTRPFEEISVQDIVRRAGKPTGSFYARFRSKEALLPFLYARYHTGLEPLFRTRLSSVAWDSLDLPAAVAAVVDLLIGLYDERRWLIRALALFARTRPEALPADLVLERRRVYDLPAGILARHRARIAHPDPEAAIRFGLYVVSTVARERLIFGQAPLARITPLGRRALRDELVRTLRAYLAFEVPA